MEHENVQRQHDEEMKNLKKDFEAKVVSEAELYEKVFFIIIDFYIYTHFLKIHYCTIAAHSQYILVLLSQVI